LTIKTLSDVSVELKRDLEQLSNPDTIYLSELTKKVWHKATFRLDEITEKSYGSRNGYRKSLEIRIFGIELHHKNKKELTKKEYLLIVPLSFAFELQRMKLDSLKTKTLKFRKNTNKNYDIELIKEVIEL
jgi:hypothetical protein